jgi:hypothetical protein
MTRPLTAFGVGQSHRFTGCIADNPQVGTPTPYNTVGDVYEDSWADGGTSAGCWYNLVHRLPGCQAAVAQDLGCKATVHPSPGGPVVVTLDDAYGITESDFFKGCSNESNPGGAFSICYWDSVGDAYCADYPSFPHTYSVNVGGVYYGHGRSTNCNCIGWSSEFGGKTQSPIACTTANGCANGPNLVVPACPPR